MFESNHSLSDDLLVICDNIRSTNNLSIVGITGYKGSGKDTVGDTLTKKLNYVKINFADSLKSVCKTIFCFSNEQLYGNDKEKTDLLWNVTPRTIMQRVGTDLFRDRLGELVPEINSKEIWLKNLLIKVLNLQKVRRSQPLKIVICDCRFQNEVDMIHALGGKVFLVDRNELKPQNLSQVHQSESGIADLSVDGIIDNNGTLEDLELNVLKKIK